MKIKVTIQDYTPFQMFHIIEMEGSVGQKLGAAALEHWRQDYGGTTRARLIDIEVCQI